MTSQRGILSHENTCFGWLFHTMRESSRSPPATPCLLSSSALGGEKNVRLHPLEQSRFPLQSPALHLGQYHPARWTTTHGSCVVRLGWHQHLLYQQPRSAKGKKSRPPTLDGCPRWRRR